MSTANSCVDPLCVRARISAQRESEYQQLKQGCRAQAVTCPGTKTLGDWEDLGARYQNRLPKASYCRNSYCSFVCFYIRILHWWPLPQVAKGEQDATTGGVWLLECCFFPACVDLCSQPYV